MTRVLVAGVGNIFFGDDAFGVEVARSLSRELLPQGTTVIDFGIRGLHLAFELMDPPDLLVLVDCMARGGAPGSLYWVDPEVDDWPCSPHAPDAHVMDPHTVLSAARQLAGGLPRTRILGCEPADVSEGMFLTEPVRRAIAPAAEMIRSLIARGGET